MNSNIDGNLLKFSCGCEFKISPDGQLDFCADSHNQNFNLNLNCPETYKVISEGLTEGVFQLTSQLGSSFTKKLKPENLDHLSALGAILRPSCLDLKLSDGKSLTEHFCRRKNHEEDIPSFHPIVDNILKSTYGIMVFQEQSMEIVKQCAGFSLQEADSLRKAIGKKLTEEMAKSKKLFLERAKTFGVLNEKQSEEIFNQIETAQRYQFNSSHSLSYAYTGYITAYIKTHFPVQFYKNWLANEKDREEYSKLINEAKLFDINVFPPSLKDLRSEFYYVKRNIYFGLSNIKGMIKNDITKIADLLSENNWLASELGQRIQWVEFLYFILSKISSRTAEGLIKSGALDCFGLDRAVLYSEYEKFLELTEKELTVYNKHTTLLYLLESISQVYEESLRGKTLLYEASLAKRKASSRTYKSELSPPQPNKRAAKITKLIGLLAQPVYSIQDTIDSLCFAEEEFLGVALTRHASDAIKVCAETHSCLDIANGYKGHAVLRVKIEKANPYKVKNGATAGKLMCFLGLSDQSYSLDNVVAFANEYEEYRHLLVKDNLVFVSGNLDKESFIVKAVYGIS